MGIRGGKRAGAGRKPKFETAQVMKRVPANVDVEALVRLVSDLQSLIESTRVDLHPTSPRDSRLREFLDELQPYLDACRSKD